MVWGDAHDLPQTVIPNAVRNRTLRLRVRGSDAVGGESRG